MKRAYFGYLPDLEDMKHIDFEDMTRLDEIVSMIGSNAIIQKILPIDDEDEELTADEIEGIREGLADYAAGNTYKDSDINWDKIGR